MIKGIIGKKIGMTQAFDEESVMVIGTLIEAGPCYVVGKKFKERDGYDAVQLGFQVDKPQRFNKAKTGLFNKSKVPSLKILKEFKAENDEYNEGDIVKADIFNSGDVLDITGVSKGKGFAGTIKRYNFHGQPMSHGGMAHRRQGSIGQASYPGRVWKGMKMPGRMGGVNQTVQGVKVVTVDAEKNILFVKGSIPGPNGGTIILKRTSKGDK
ncbi:MAG: 50S ribosomal protein L3 [Thermodesulfobacteriota bacterium]